VATQAMLRIQRSHSEKAAFSLSGRIGIEDVAELQRMFHSVAGEVIKLDLKDVTLIDRDAVKYLARWEEECVKLENCPAYIREWIDQGRTREKKVGD